MEPNVTSDDSEENVLRVKSSSSASSLASAIAHGVYDNRTIKLRAIGAGAVNQAVKAIAIARSYVASRGVDLYDVPGFANVTMGDGEEISAIVFNIHVK